MITVKHLSVVYPDKTVALDDINLEIQDGESVAIIGKNGSGKTSLLMSMVGIVDFNGEIIVNDISLTNKTKREIRREIGVVFQNPDDQLFMPTIHDDIAFGLRNMGVEEQEIEQKIDDCLKKLNIERLKEKASYRLSGGEKRMSAIATVLAMEPSIMIFDEPGAFLDLGARRTLIDTLNEIDRTKIIVTHDILLANETCKKAIVIKEGKLCAYGDTKDVLYDDALMEMSGGESIKRYCCGSGHHH